MNNNRTRNFCETTDKNDFVTLFQRDCISEISVLCAKRKRAVLKKNILLGLSATFGAVSLIFSLLAIFTADGKKKKWTVFGILAAFFSFAAITLTYHYSRIRKKEDSISDGISFLEDAVEASEHIL